MKNKLKDMKDLDAANHLLENHQDIFDVTSPMGSIDAKKLQVACEFLSKAQQYTFRNIEELEHYMSKEKSYQQMVSKPFNVDPKLLFVAYQRAHKNYMNPQDAEQQQQYEQAKLIASRVLSLIKNNPKNPSSQIQEEQRLIKFFKKHEKKKYHDINPFIDALKKDPEFQKLTASEKHFKFRPDILFDAWKKNRHEYDQSNSEQLADVQMPEVYSNVASEQNASMGVLASSAAGTNEQDDEAIAQAAAGVNSDAATLTLRSGGGTSSSTGKGFPRANSRSAGLAPIVSGPRSPLMNTKNVSLHNQSHEHGVTDKQFKQSNEVEKQKQKSSAPSPFKKEPSLKPEGSG